MDKEQRQIQIDKLKHGFFARNGGWVRRKGLELAKEKIGKTMHLELHQYGICAGYSMLWLHQYLRELKIDYFDFIGFDSFEGLPPEAVGIPTEQSWKPGAYSFKEEFSCIDREEARLVTQEFFAQMNFFPTLVPGFYDQTLNQNLINALGLRKVFYVDIDCDLYTSAKTVLNFLYDHNLLLEGTVFFYDDWYGTADGEGGESKAHYEWTQAHNVQGKLMKYPEGVLFQIEKL